MKFDLQEVQFELLHRFAPTKPSPARTILPDARRTTVHTEPPPEAFGSRPKCRRDPIGTCDSTDSATGAV